MGYKIEAVPGEPIIVETWDAHYSPTSDAPRAAQDMIRMMDKLNQSVVVIVDMRAANLSFNDIMQMVQLATSKSAPARHPLQRRRIIVTDSSVISMAAQGLDNAVFGHIMVDIAYSMEEALEKARE